MQAHHTLTIQNKKSVRGSAGQSEYVDDGPPIKVRGNLHPLSSDELQLWGDTNRQTRKWFGKTWPADTHSEITFDGELWDQVAPAEKFDIGQRTKHFEVVLRKR